MTKVMRGRTALQSTSCEMQERSLFCFAKAFRVRTRPRIALDRRGGGVRIFALALLSVVPLSISAAARNRSAMQVPGYRAVPVHYGPMNKMIMSVRINGQPTNLLVDTGSNQLILETDAAE